MQVVQDFSITKSSRLCEFIEFKNNNLPRTKFRHEPVFSSEDGAYQISIRSSAVDLASLELLFEKWEKEDEVPSQKMNILEKIFINLRSN